MNPIEKRILLKGYLEGRPNMVSDQRQGLPQPPLEKPFPEGAEPIDLPSWREATVAQPELSACIRDRESHRSFTKAPLSLEQLSYLLWATQGVTKVSADGYYTRRTVPSAGARHPFETYLALRGVTGLAEGTYRYLALSHRLLFLGPADGLRDGLADACCGQGFCGDAPVFFAWAVLPYRTEWRYGEFAARAILLDAGHVCQNLYLACEALGLGTCGIGAYMQERLDGLFGLDGTDEFVTYAAPVGVPKVSDSASGSE